LCEKTLIAESEGLAVIFKPSPGMANLFMGHEGKSKPVVEVTALYLVIIGYSTTIVINLRENGEHHVK